MKQILPYLKAYTRDSILSPLFKLIEALLELLVPLIIADIIDVGVAAGDKGYILLRCGLMIGLGLLGLACSVTAQYFAARAATGFTAKIRGALFSHIQTLSYADLDQIGTPTYTFDLARLLVDMLESDKYGYYHATNEGGYISWYDFTCEIFRQAGIDSVKVLPVTTAEYGLSKAARPFNSRLDKSKLRANGFAPLPDWKDALRRFLQEYRTADR